MQLELVRKQAFGPTGPHATPLDLLFCRVPYSEYTAIGAEHGVLCGTECQLWEQINIFGTLPVTSANVYKKYIVTIFLKMTRYTDIMY